MKSTWRIGRAIVFTLTLAISASAWAGSTASPTLVRTESVAPGAELDVYAFESSVQNPQEVWLYRPDPLPHDVTLVIVPPAGGRLVTAASLSVGDQPEHLPYVMAGFAVVSFTMKGTLADDAGELEFIEAALNFQSGRAGVNNARTALDFALGTLRNVDYDRIYVAGHSSAATLALLLAANEPRIRGVVAFAPVWDVSTFLGPELIQAFDEINPGYRRFIEWSSPVSHMERLSMPVLLFHARDDEVIPYSEAAHFADLAQSSGVNVEFRTAESGGHYYSMVEVGIPSAIRWLKSLKKP